MDWLSLLPAVLQLIEQIPAIKAAFDTTPTNSMAAIGNVIANTGTAPLLEQIGRQLFPKLAPTIQAAAAALTMAHPSATAYLQASLNILGSTGFIALAAPLATDGVYGAKTTAAVAALETKLGLPVDGFAGDAVNAAIAAAIAAIPVKS